MKRSQALELRRKKFALLALWNRLAVELRGTQAEENAGNLYTAGHLLRLCEDKQGLFETKARKFLSESWRTHRALGHFLSAWRKGEPDTPVEVIPAKLSEPCGVNYQGYWRRPDWLDDPKNVPIEDLKAWAAKMARGAASREAQTSP